MKKHAIIPIFISHRGCPNDCVFCNQKKITAREGDVTVQQAREVAETWLSTIERSSVETIEMAFYGGSFTGIPMSEQRQFLSLAKEYKDAGRIHRIHLSTRPDYIDDKILDMLKDYSVDVIELGVQSFDDEVLRMSNRGHDSRIVYESCRRIKEYGFTLGIQLMIGLPGDSMEKCINSAKEAVSLSPEIARLYPVVILEDTELAEMFRDGRYSPFSHDESVQITAEMYKILQGAGINIIRVGLKSTDVITTENSLGSTYHPSFRQLVEGRIAMERILKELSVLGLEPTDPKHDHSGQNTEKSNTETSNLESNGHTEKSSKSNPAPTSTNEPRGTIEITCAPRDVSNAAGLRSQNRKELERLFPGFKTRIKADETIEEGRYVVNIKRL